MIDNNDRVNNEFYVCPVFNYAIKVNIIGTLPKHGIEPEDLNVYQQKQMILISHRGNIDGKSE